MDRLNFFAARKFLVAGGLAIGLAAGVIVSPGGARAQSGQPAASDSSATAQAQPAPQPTAQPAPPPSVTAATAERHEMIGRVPVSGTLVARREILIYPQVSGYTIDSIAVDEGDFVAEGDVLAQLNDTTLQAQYAQAQAEAARAQAAVSQASSQIASADASKTQADAALSRTSRLRSSGNVSQATLDDAQANAQTAAAAAQSARDGLAVAQAQMQQAQAQLRIAQLNLDHATLLAPASGLISQRNGQIGAIAASGGEPIFRLIQDGVVEVQSEVIETALAQISDGDPAQIDIAGLGRVNGKVRLIAPTVDPVNRLGTVLISLDSTESLRSGLFAGGWIITDRRDSVTVPATAVLTDGTQNYVLRLQDGVVERRDVAAGLIWDNRREILTGLAEGDVVIAKAGAFFGDGDRVQPVFPEQPAASGDASGASQTQTPIAAPTPPVATPPVATPPAPPAPAAETGAAPAKADPAAQDAATAAGDVQ